MPLFYCRSGLLGLLLLGAGPVARAQTTPGITATVVLPLAATPYAAAHDSLMRRVTRVYAQAGARASYFQAAQGSFGGLHRRVQAYVRASSSRYLLREVVKRKFGVELQKVRYYDAAGHKILIERYEGHQLTRLELREYPAGPTRLNKPLAKWLLVRGDYLRHDVQTAPNHTTSQYYYQRRPPGEAP